MNTTPLHELYLAAVVALGLVLPLMAGALAPRNPTGPKPWLRTVLAGQACVAIGALMMMWSSLHPVYGLGVAAVGCAIFTVRLHRQLQHKVVEARSRRRPAVSDES